MSYTDMELALWKDKLQSAALKIEAAFGDEPYPVGVEVVSDQDGEWQVEAYANKHWRDISTEVLSKTSLSFFSREGFRFFLPAFLLASLREEDDNNGTIRGYISIVLSAKNEFRYALLLESISLFSLEQLYAVQYFLRTIKETYYSEIYTRKISVGINCYDPDGIWLGSDFPKRLLLSEFKKTN